MATNVRYDFFEDRFDRSYLRVVPVEGTKSEMLEAKTLATVRDLAVSRRRLAKHPALAGSFLVKAAAAAVVTAFALPVVLGLGSTPAEAGVVDGNGNPINTGSGGTVGTTDETNGGSSNQAVWMEHEGFRFNSRAPVGAPGSLYHHDGSIRGTQHEVNCGCRGNHAPGTPTGNGGGDGNGNGDGNGGGGGDGNGDGTGDGNGVNEPTNQNVPGDNNTNSPTENDSPDNSAPETTPTCEICGGDNPPSADVQAAALTAAIRFDETARQEAREQGYGYPDVYPYRVTPEVVERWKDEAEAREEAQEEARQERLEEEATYRNELTTWEETRRQDDIADPAAGVERVEGRIEQLKASIQANKAKAAELRALLEDNPGTYADTAIEVYDQRAADAEEDLEEAEEWLEDLQDMPQPDGLETQKAIEALEDERFQPSAAIGTNEREIERLEQQLQASKDELAKFDDPNYRDRFGRGKTVFEDSVKHFEEKLQQEKAELTNNVSEVNRIDAEIEGLKNPTAPAVPQPPTPPPVSTPTPPEPPSSDTPPPNTDDSVPDDVTAPVPPQLPNREDPEPEPETPTPADPEPETPTPAGPEPEPETPTAETPTAETYDGPGYPTLSSAQRSAVVKAEQHDRWAKSNRWAAERLRGLLEDETNQDKRDYLSERIAGYEESAKKNDEIAEQTRDDHGIRPPAEERNDGTFEIDQTQYDNLEVLAKNNRRPEYYMELYNLTGTPLFAEMAQISSNSGMLGGIAWRANDIIVNERPEIYPSPGSPADARISDFSKKIFEGNFEDIKPIETDTGEQKYSIQDELGVSRRAYERWVEENPGFADIAPPLLRYVQQIGTEGNTEELQELMEKLDATGNLEGFDDLQLSDEIETLISEGVIETVDDLYRELEGDGSSDIGELIDYGREYPAVEVGIQSIIDEIAARHFGADPTKGFYEEDFIEAHGGLGNVTIEYSLDGQFKIISSDKSNISEESKKSYENVTSHPTKHVIVVPA